MRQQAKIDNNNTKHRPGGKSQYNRYQQCGRKNQNESSVRSKGREEEKEEKERTKKKNNKNIDQIRYEGLVTDDIMKGATISPGSSGRVTSDRSSLLLVL